jgi:hypothetical protein
MPALPQRPAPRLRALAAVGLAHLALLMALGTARVWPDRDRATQPVPLWLRWVEPEPGPGAAPAPDRKRERTAATPARPAPPRPVRGPERARAAAEPAAITALPAAPPGSAAAAGAPVSAPGDASPAPRATAPLQLDLPRAASAPRRNPALDDPRANTPKASFESRLNDAMGGVGERVVEERLSDGTLRLKRGTQCVLVHPSRAAGIDPFNEAYSPKARGVEKCP